MAKTLTAETREMKNPREMRRSGEIPAVVYGRDFHKEISVRGRDLEKLLGSMTRSSRVDLTVNGESHGVFIKEIQFHPLNDNVLHVDFFKPSEGQVIKMEVPIKFIGEPRGRRKGGAVVRVRDTVEIKGPAEAIPEIFEPDITEIEVGGKLRAGDLELPENTELVTTPDVLLLQVVIPRRAKAEGEEGEEEAAEGEIPTVAAEGASESADSKTEGEESEESTPSEE